jgi:hypothetical protein
MVTISRVGLATIVKRVRDYRGVIEDLRARQLDSETLLYRALQELALEKGVEPQHFSRKWLSQNRPQERGGEALRAG